MFEPANVWLKSRVPNVEARIRGHRVERAGSSSYADIIHAGRRFRFSHAQQLMTATVSEPWLIFEDRGAALR